VRLEGLRQLKKSNDLIGNRTRFLPAFSIVPPPTTLPLQHTNISGHMLIQNIFLVLYVEVVPKICPHLSVTPVKCGIMKPVQINLTLNEYSSK
jgi:hypothetical protein